jgi:hypothetical protein
MPKPAKKINCVVWGVRIDHLGVSAELERIIKKDIKHAFGYEVSCIYLSPECEVEHLQVGKRRDYPVLNPPRK